MPTLQERLAAPAADSRSLQGMLARGAANYNGSLSANGNSGTQENFGVPYDTGTPTQPEMFGQPYDTGNPLATAVTPPVSGAPIGTATGTPVANPTEIGNSGDTQADFNYWSSKNNLNRDTSQLDSDANLQNTRNQSDLRSAYEQAARNYTKSKEASKNNFANNGLLFSGGFVQDQADIGEDYNRNTDDLASAGQRAFEDLTRQTVERKNLIEQQRLDIERQQAQAKANADLQKSLIEAQTKAMADLKAGLTGGGTVNTPTGVASIGSPGAGYASGGQYDPGIGNYFDLRIPGSY